MLQGEQSEFPHKFTYGQVTVYILKEEDGINEKINCGSGTLFLFDNNIINEKGPILKVTSFDTNDFDQNDDNTLVIYEGELLGCLDFEEMSKGNLS